MAYPLNLSMAEEVCSGINGNFWSLARLAPLARSSLISMSVATEPG